MKRSLSFNQLGFTLIELVIVIVLLGILSAVALPRFLDLSTEARRSVNQGVLGSLASSSSTLSGRAQIPPGGTSPTPATQTNLGGSTAIDLDPNKPSGAGVYLWFDSASHVVGGSTTAARNANNQLTTPSGNDATMDSNATLQKACTNIFNGLLADSSVRAANASGTTTAKTDGAIAAGAVATGTAAYQTLNTISITPTSPTTGIPTGGFMPNTAAGGGSSPVTGSCMWVKTDSIGGSTVFYIYYDANSGQFTAVEAKN